MSYELTKQKTGMNTLWVMQLKMAWGRSINGKKVPSQINILLGSTTYELNIYTFKEMEIVQCRKIITKYSLVSDGMRGTNLFTVKEMHKPNKLPGLTAQFFVHTD